MSPRRVIFVHRELGVFLGVDELNQSWFAKDNRLGLEMVTTFDNMLNAHLFFRMKTNLDPDLLTPVEVEPSRGIFATVLDLSKAGVAAEDLGDLMKYQSYLPGIH